MSNLIKRYNFEEEYNSGRGVVEVLDGGWVKFDDIKEFLPSTSYNNARQEINCRTCNSPGTLSVGSRCLKCVQFSEWQLTSAVA